MSEEIIIKGLHKHFANHDYRLSNVFMYLWESDFFCVSTSGYAIEVEVKISKSDFKADFKKTEKHHILKNGNKSHVVIPGHENKWADAKYTPITIIPSIRPNKFYYCCPENMISENDIPDYAGLLYFKDESEDGYNYSSIKQIKSAKFIHKDKLDLSKRLLDKYYWMCMNLQYDISILRDRLSEVEKFFDCKDDYDRKLKTKQIQESPYFQSKLFDI